MLIIGAIDSRLAEIYGAADLETAADPVGPATAAFLRIANVHILGTSPTSRIDERASDEAAFRGHAVAKPLTYVDQTGAM